MHSCNFDWSAKFLTNDIILIYLTDLYFFNFLKILDRWCYLSYAVITMITLFFKFLLQKIFLVQKYRLFFRFYILFFFAVYFQSQILKYILLLLEEERKIFLYLFVVNLGNCFYQLYFIVLCFVMVVVLVYYVDYKSIWLSILIHCYSIQTIEWNTAA